MSGLSSDLNSYLSKSSSSNSLSSLTSKFSSIKLPALKTPFGGGGGDGGQDDEEPFLGVVSDSNGGSANNRKENQSWLARKMEESLPSLSKKQRILGFMTSLLLGNQAGQASFYLVINLYLLGRYNLLWSGCIISPPHHCQSQKIFPPLHTGKCIHPVEVGFHLSRQCEPLNLIFCFQFLLPVGPLQSPGPPV